MSEYLKWGLVCFTPIWVVIYVARSIIRTYFKEKRAYLKTMLQSDADEANNEKE